MTKIKTASESTPLINSPGTSTTDLANDAEIEIQEDSVSVCDSHQEPHFGSAEIIRDIIIGLSDGLTVPFALAAGLATLDNSRLVVTAGVAGKNN